MARIMKRFFIAAGMAVMGWLLPSVSSAQVQSYCPRGYFQANASNSFDDSRLRTRVCILINTAPTQIGMRLIATAELPITDAIERAVSRSMAGAQACSLTNVAGWSIHELDVRLAGSSSAPKLRIGLTGRECLNRFAEGVRFTYEVPLVASFSGNRLSIRPDFSRASVSSAYLRARAFSAQIVTAMNAYVTRLSGPWDYSGFLPEYTRFMDAKVQRVDIVYRERKLMMRAEGTGRLSRPDAERLLRSAVDNKVMPLMRQWLNPMGS